MLNNCKPARVGFSGQLGAFVATLGLAGCCVLTGARAMANPFTAGDVVVSQENFVGADPTNAYVQSTINADTTAGNAGNVFADLFNNPNIPGIDGVYQLSEYLPSEHWDRFGQCRIRAGHTTDAAFGPKCRPGTDRQFQQQI